jgi:hypothetical protein
VISDEGRAAILQLRFSAESGNITGATPAGTGRGGGGEPGRTGDPGRALGAARPSARGRLVEGPDEENFRSGASRLSSDVAGRAVGVRAWAEGADQFSDGLIQLADGGDSLTAATEKFARGLAEGHREMPTYTVSGR